MSSVLALVVWWQGAPGCRVTPKVRAPTGPAALPPHPPSTAPHPPVMESMMVMKRLMRAWLSFSLPGGMRALEKPGIMDMT